MSLLEHLRSTSRGVQAPAPEPPTWPVSEPVHVALPPAAPSDSSLRTRAPGRNEALIDLKARVHEELIHELDPDQLQGDLGLLSPARRAVEQAAEEALNAADPSLGRQERLKLASEIADEVLGFGPLEPLLRDPSVTEGAA